MQLVTQWRLDPNGTRCGFDYPAVLAHLQFSVDDAAERRQLYADLRVMEHAAVEEHQKAAQAAFEKAREEQARQLNRNPPER